MGWLILWFILWVPLTILSCKCAENRGRSAGKWFVFCLFLSPIIALIAIFCLPDLKLESEKFESERQEHINNMRIKKEDFIEQLNSICSLNEHGIINDAEFCQEKDTLISQLAYRRIEDSPEMFLCALIPFKEKGTLTQRDVDLIKSEIFY